MNRRPSKRYLIPFCIIVLLSGVVVALARVGMVWAAPIVTATIPVGPVPQGVGADANTDTIYIATHPNSVYVIDGRTNTVTATIPVGTNPDGVGIMPNTDTIYVANSGDNTVSVIDGRTNTVTATVPVGLLPIKVATDPHTDTAYVINGAGNTVSVIAGH